MGAAFYCVADDRYFLGAVGTINSLRVLGHTEPVIVCDCGLTDSQRALLASETELVPAPSEAPATLLKTVGPLARPAETMVLIDTDMIATRRLDELLETAAAGAVVAFRNDTERHVPEWGEVLDLGVVRRQPYVSFGFVAMPGELGAQVLALVADRQRAIDFDRTYWREQRITDYPLLYADQDVLNAILASRVDADRLRALDQRLAPLPPFAGLSVADDQRLRCVYEDGSEPYVLHHWLAKPWIEETHHGVYSQLLRRLLIGDDVAIKVPEHDLPLRFRRGARAFAERKRINARERLRWHVKEPLAARSGRGRG